MADIPAAINLAEKLAAFSERWSPRIVAAVNDYHVKLVKMQGDFVWHSHPETDELFLVLSGELTIAFRDGSVTLGAGELAVVPRGVEHKPSATVECEILLLEPAGTMNTGNAAASDRTRGAGEWV